MSYLDTTIGETERSKHNLGSCRSGIIRVYGVKYPLFWTYFSDSELGLKMGESLCGKSSMMTAHASRDVLCNTPPSPGRVSRRPVGIPGESRCSGLGLGFDGIVKDRVLSPRHERFPEQSREGLPDSISGLILGDFRSIL